MTRRFTNLSPQYMAGTIDRLNYVLGGIWIWAGLWIWAGFGWGQPPIAPLRQGRRLARE
jgi:hypothetical protein